MNKLLKKEFILAMHPTSLIFLALSAMLLIPNYPYYVTFFYTGLAIFFTCLSGRENHDVFYTMSLPIAKSSVVRARFGLTVLLELAQLVLAIPFAWLRQGMSLPGNQVGMDANIAFFGLALVMMGLFNYVFYSLYYRDVSQVGKAFLITSVAVFLYMSLAEALTHIIPLFRDQLDTPDPQYLGAKLAVLAAGAAIFALLTWLAYRKSVRSFQRLDV